MTADDTKILPDYRASVFLPETDFPMRAGLPKKEPELLERWQRLGMYRRMREQAKGREKYVLHDGPPYANGHLHIGHALNKILKDVVTRSHQMMGYDSNYVPGWDCHGLPIEWKIEEQYRAKGRNKDEVPVNEFRAECRDFARHWVDVQRAEFKRLGVEGDWDNPYTTMSFAAEAQIAREIMKFARTGQLYRGSKPVMWSVVEKTALAEAEVEYHEVKSDAIWVKFPVAEVDVSPTSMLAALMTPLADETNRDNQIAAEVTKRQIEELKDAFVVIWTTTPWTIPCNRAICYSNAVSYALYEVTAAENDFGPQAGEKLILAEGLSADCARSAKLELNRLREVAADELTAIVCAHPLKDFGYTFDVPLLAGEHVTAETGTGFVHTAPGHGREDFDVWMDNKARLEARGIDTLIPYTVDADGFYTEAAPGFEGRRVITDKGEKGDANEAVIKALIGADRLFARSRITHDYPHSWRSKKPVIFRNTPQWFIAMDGDIEGAGDTLRARALKAIADTRFVPEAGRARINGMIANRPDWVVSRQRAWGVPIAVFAREDGEILNDEAVDERIAAAFEAEGADAWFAQGARERFLGARANEDWLKVDDILDVWFDSGSTHAFVLEAREDLKWPASLYLEGSDQHRGWFHSSLLESCGTRGRAPYDGVLTHGFVMDEQGRKMSKSLGNTTEPQKVVDQYGADILRLWVMSSDYAEDLRIGPEIVKSNADAYRRLRNTIRFMLGNLSGFDESERLPFDQMPELERWVLHRLAELDAATRKGYSDFAYQRAFSALFNFCTVDLSSVYFDIRKDALYCDDAASITRRACRTVLDHLFTCVVTWLAPMLCFTMEEAWLTRFPGAEESVHLQLFPAIPAEWRNEALGRKFAAMRTVRRVVTGALELERAEKRIGASLEASPVLFLSDRDLLAAIAALDMAELCITSGFAVRPLAEAPQGAFRLPESQDKLAVVVASAEGGKCARCWKILPDVGAHEAAPGTCSRCASVLAARG